MPELILQDDLMCFVCGKNNPCGLKLNFVLDKDRILKTEFTFAKIHQGFKDIVHGGLIGLILDEVMVNLLWIEREDNRIVYTKASAQDEEGSIYAQAQAKCVKIK